MTDHKMRISSTQLNTFADCPTKWHREYVLGIPGSFGKAASIGSLCHSIIEFRIAHGFEPSKSILCKLKGNYDDPRDHLRRYPSAWEPALEMARYIEDPLAFVPEGFDLGLGGVEVCLDELAVEIAPGVLCGGYFDLLAFNADRTEAWIGDWKTRGKTSWKIRPTSKEDFENNIQFTYYAAALSQAYPDLTRVWVDHINILRPGDGGPAVKVDGTMFTREFLKIVWMGLQAGPVASMIQLAEDETPPVPSMDTGPCWKYGKCGHLRACTQALNPAPKTDDGPGFFESLASPGFFGSLK